MITIQKLTEDDKSVRTQITLTDKLKTLVEDTALQRGESLSEYLRKAAVIRLLVEMQEKENMEALAKKVVGSIKKNDNPNWRTKAGIYKWSRKIREEW